MFCSNYYRPRILLWQDHTGKPFPGIILVCPNTGTKNHLFYYIRERLDEDDHPDFYLTTRELIQTKGLTNETLGKILSKAE